MAAVTSSQLLSPSTAARPSAQRIASGSGTSTPGASSSSSSSSFAHPLARKVRDVLLAPTPTDLQATRKALDEIARLFPAAPATSTPRSSGGVGAGGAAVEARDEAPAQVEVDISRARDNLARDTERRAARAARQFSKVLGSVNNVSVGCVYACRRGLTDSAASPPGTGNTERACRLYAAHCRRRRG